MDSVELQRQVSENFVAIEEGIARVNTKLQNIDVNTGGTNDSLNTQKEQLVTENKKLSAEIAQMLKKLLLLEIENGVKQIFTPRAAPASKQQGVSPQKTDVAAATSDDTPTVASQSVTAPAKETTAVKTPKKKAATSGLQPTAKVEERPVDVSRLDIRVGRIVSAECHPNADTLYVEQVDVGESSNRTIVSGLVGHVPLEQMQNRLALFMCNLKPVKMRGILSQGMIMCAAKDGAFEIIDPPSEGCSPGDRVSVEGFPGVPDEQLPPKKKIWEALQPQLGCDGEGRACFRSVPWTVGSGGTGGGQGGFCMAPTLKDAEVR